MPRAPRSKKSSSLHQEYRKAVKTPKKAKSKAAKKSNYPSLEDHIRKRLANQNREHALIDAKSFLAWNERYNEYMKIGGDEHILCKRLIQEAESSSKIM
tara:strand:- start:231 stop:527 length:297 start_codon:yes stop_codon:yes gene_type:complete